jgi:cytochrome c-type biogenesis protein CcmH/NrfG
MRHTGSIAAEKQAKTRRTRTLLAFSLALFSCVLGLVFCVVKSPQSRSEAYLAMAAEAITQSRPQEAAAAAMEAVRLNPAAPKAWQLLSKLLRENGQGQAAKQALVIAARLQQNPDPTPVYAMPADLRLSLLVLAETGNP